MLLYIETEKGFFSPTRSNLSCCISQAFALDIRKYLFTLFLFSKYWPTIIAFVSKRLNLHPHKKFALQINAAFKGTKNVENIAQIIINATTRDVMAVCEDMPKEKIN